MMNHMFSKELFGFIVLFIWIFPAENLFIFYGDVKVVTKSLRTRATASKTSSANKLL